MKRTRTPLILSALAASALLAGAGVAAAAAPGHATILIRHQTRGCHAWSANGGAFAAAQTVTLRRGGWLTVTNNDVMPHKLVETSGPAARMTNLPGGSMGMGLKGTFGPGMMAHMGAITKVVFAKAGVYRFATKAGEDYKQAESMKTVGEDYTLRLTVKVV